MNITQINAINKSRAFRAGNPAPENTTKPDMQAQNVKKNNYNFEIGASVALAAASGFAIYKILKGKNTEPESKVIKNASMEIVGGGDKNNSNVVSSATNIVSTATNVVKETVGGGDKNDSNVVSSVTNVVKETAQTIVDVGDVKYKNKLLEGLKAMGVEVKAEALNSIVGPQEFKELVKKFKPEQFQAGLQVSYSDATLEEFYKNSVDGNFRVSLHTHSNFSDGKSTPEVFIECARRYADKVAKLNKNDGLPPLTIALTDHDNVNGCKEVIKIIAQNPKKYKNVKFVSGCEFSVKDESKKIHHDLTGLALNPFDGSLNELLTRLKNARTKTVEDFLTSKPPFKGKKVTLKDLAEVESAKNIKEGKPTKRTIENGAGIVFVRHAIKFYYKFIGCGEVNHKEMNIYGDKDILPIEKVIDAVKKNGGYTSLTHPLKSFWRYIGDDDLTRLKNMGVSGIEVNHQYTPSKIAKMGDKNECNGDEIYKKLTEKYKQFAEKNGMFMSGGTDCHETQIFSRQPHITEDFLENKLLK